MTENLSPLESAIPSFGSPTLQGFETPSQVVDGQRIGGSNSGSNRQHVRFYKKKVVEMKATEVKKFERGGFVSETPMKFAAEEVEREFVHIVTPGDKNEYNNVVFPYHKREFFRQYQAFRDGKAAPLGTSLESCEFLSPDIVTELKFFNCHTLEQLADASDSLCGNFLDGYAYREIARATCKANLENQSLNQVNVLKGELEKSNLVIVEMQKQMEEMRGLIVDSKGEVISTPSGRGAPSKQGKQ